MGGKTRASLTRNVMKFMRHVNRNVKYRGPELRFDHRPVSTSMKLYRFCR